MLRPSDLIETAKLLASATVRSPTDADLRRSISTAYYAVFHTVLTAGADRFFGVADRNGGGYSLLYRAFDHGRMKRSCEDVARQALTPAQRGHFGRTAFHPDLRAFAQIFVRLQVARIGADYDLRATFTAVQAQTLIEEAERAIASFAAAPDEERSDLLALMLGSRN